eukprot:31473-Pelagococcus_subviridis.AAC.11
MRSESCQYRVVLPSATKKLNVETHETGFSCRSEFSQNARKFTATSRTICPAASPYPSSRKKRQLKPTRPPVCQKRPNQYDDH